MQGKKISIVLFNEYDQTLLNEKSQELSSAVLEYHKVEDEKKASASMFKETLDGIEATISSLAKSIRRKGEDKATDCLVKFHNPVPGMKTTIRLDTGDTVKTEEMTADEKQTELFDDVEELTDLFMKPSDENPTEEK